MKSVLNRRKRKWSLHELRKACESLQKLEIAIRNLKKDNLTDEFKTLLVTVETGIDKANFDLNYWQGRKS